MSIQGREKNFYVGEPEERSQPSWLAGDKRLIKHPKTIPRKNDSKHHIWSLSFNFRFSSKKSQI